MKLSPSCTRGRGAGAGKGRSSSRGWDSPIRSASAAMPNLANPGRSGGVCGRDSACRPLAAGWSNVTNLLWGNEAVETIRVMHFCAWERLAGAYRESDGEPVRDEREAGRQVEFPEHAASGRLFHGLKA